MVAEVLVEVDVVDADDLAAVNVDDLLVEEIALQQQQALGAGESGPVGGPGAGLDDAVDGLDLGEREQAVFAGAQADDQGGESDGVVLGSQRDLAHTSGKGAGGVKDGRAQQLGKGERRHGFRLQATGFRLDARWRSRWL